MSLIVITPYRNVPSGSPHGLQVPGASHLDETVTPQPVANISYEQFGSEVKLPSIGGDIGIVVWVDPDTFQHVLMKYAESTVPVNA
jgi:hypothetical protein